MALNVTEAVNTAAFENNYTAEQGAQPEYLAQGLVNDVELLAVRIVELVEGGECCIFVRHAPDTTKPDATVDAVIIQPNGAERVYKDVAQAIQAVLKIGFGGQVDAPIELVRKIVSKPMTDPVHYAKSQYTALKKELDIATTSSEAMSKKLEMAMNIGWSAYPTHSSEYAAYSQINSSAAAIAEWHAMLDDKVGNLAETLTSAGIDPATFANIIAAPTV